MFRRIARALWLGACLGLPALWLWGCDDGPRGDCDTVCTYAVDCAEICHPEDDACDEAERRQLMYGSCVEPCTAGVDAPKEGCADSAAQYADCLSAQGCGLGCASQQTRYAELCLLVAGDTTCRGVCGKLERGCVPHTLFGLRDPDCNDACLEAASELPCRDALARFDECASDFFSYCQWLGDDCAAEVADVQASCTQLQPVEPGADELAFCESIAPTECRCRPTTIAECELEATHKCLYDLGAGAACRAAYEASYECLDALAACTNDEETLECSELAGKRTEACDLFLVSP